MKKKSVDMLARDKYLTDKYRVIRGSVINKPGECRHTGRGEQVVRVKRRLGDKCFIFLKINTKTLPSYIVN